MTKDGAALALVPAELTAGLSEEEKQVLLQVYQEQFQLSREGFDFKPQRIKINKDTQMFTDPLGNNLEELRGVILLKQKTRGHWPPQGSGDKRPLCSSLDGISGTDRNGKTHNCKTCPLNAWGSASDGNQERRGKACKEMRRVFLLPEGAQLPYVISLPPTSLAAWDNYCSARLTQNLPDIAAEAVLRLVPGQIGGFNVSIIKPSIGKKLAPAQILQMVKLQKEFADSWKRTEITDEDYDTGESVNSNEPWN